MIEETRKILRMPDLRVTTTTVQSSTLMLSLLTLNWNEDFDLADIRQAFQEAEGIILLDDPANLVSIPLRSEVEDHDEVYVGRIR